MSHAAIVSRPRSPALLRGSAPALLACVALWLAPATLRSADDAAMPMKHNDEVTAAIAVLAPTVDHEVRGVVRFAKVSGGVRVTGLISNLKPGKHGFHIHQYGDTTAPDGTSAGGHFNPTHQPHGAPDATARHVGDLGNVTADADGNARINVVDSTIALEGPNSIIGRGVVVHEDPDDLTSQPTGNAGARVATGVIGVAKAGS